MKPLVIGGGLSGLALAEMLEAAGRDYLLVEARNRFGGRIKTETCGAGYFDMGPAWFWPGQPRMAAITQRLGLETFAQYADGMTCVEDHQTRVQHRHGGAAMQGSWRIKGGLAALTTALFGRLPEARKRLNTTVTRLAKTDDGIIATTDTGALIKGDRAVLALPPRIAATMDYTPVLPDVAMGSMQSIATWMAGQAKAVALYETPFWRQAGLSGAAISRHGPMVEIHDACPAEDGPYALFGFIGVPPAGRGDIEALRQQLRAQLVRLFGAQAAEPKALYIKDWAFDRHTATEADKAPLFAHPTYGLPGTMSRLWQNDLLFAGTEVAPQFGGYLEGALEAAENAFAMLQS